jgi:hypothetical protein
MVLRLRRRSSAIGWLAALALLAGQLSSVVHLLVVQHQRCPQHGELVHAAEGTPLASSPRVGDGAALGPAESPEGHGHDHCLYLIHRPEVMAPPGAGALVTVLADAPFLDKIVARPASFPLFRLAPKTSPPVG